MHTPSFSIPQINRPDPAIAPLLQKKIDGKTKPIGALGRIETLALQIGLIQNTLTPALTQPHLLIFAGDHGIATAGVSLYPPEVTWQMVMNFLQGGAAANVFAHSVGMTINVVDAGVNHHFTANERLLHRKIAMGTKNFAEGPAMTREECESAIKSGFAIVHDLHSKGCNTLALGEMGIANTSSASLISALMMKMPLAQCVGRGTGLDDEGVTRKRLILEKALAFHLADSTFNPAEPLQVLSRFGGFEMAMMVGAMLMAAHKRMVVIVDGFISTAAWAVAHQLAPALMSYSIFSHCSHENAHQAVLNKLAAHPLLSLDLRLGEGTGALLCYPLLVAAVAMINQMASFDSVGVSQVHD